MSEREKFPSWSVLQQTDMSLREPDSLVARGLSALLERKRSELVLNSQDGRYRQRARVDRQVCNYPQEGLDEEERERLFSHSSRWGRMAARNTARPISRWPVLQLRLRILPSGQDAADDAGFSC